MNCSNEDIMGKDQIDEFADKLIELASELKKPLPNPETVARLGMDCGMDLHLVNTESATIN